jgi:mannan endo-1,4-beta-mannosidase
MPENFRVDGRDLLDLNGNPVILRGINKMSVFDNAPNQDPGSAISFREIRKAGANSVRIVWTMTQNMEPTGTPTNPNDLNLFIQNAIANNLVPMIELHDATGNWYRLDELVDYWCRADIVQIIQYHRKYLLVNIGNEVGDYSVTDADFSAKYTAAIQKMRAKGIHTPLVVDAPDYGKNLDVLNNTAAALLNADPDKNILFSLHLYWAKAPYDGTPPRNIAANLQAAVALGYPLIIGEFCKYGAYAGGASICSPAGEIDYKAILEECQKRSIGWYVWEWGPGNGYNPTTGLNDGPCKVMDMTPDRLFSSMDPNGWAYEVAVASPYSIMNTAVTAVTS